MNNYTNLLVVFTLLMTSLFFSCSTSRKNNFVSTTANNLEEERSGLAISEKFYSEKLSKRIPIRRELTVKDFGAIGDGVTDDTEAIKKAFKYVVENNIRKIIFDYTDLGYVISDEILLENINGLTIEGASPGGVTSTEGLRLKYRTLIWKGNSNKAIFRIGRTCNNLRFSNLGFALEGAPKSVALAAIFIDNRKRDIVVRNLQIENCDFNEGRFAIILSTPLKGNGDVAPVSIRNSLFRNQRDFCIFSNNRNNQLYVNDSHFIRHGNNPKRDSFNPSQKGGAICSSGALSVFNCSFINLSGLPHSHDLCILNGLVSIDQAWVESHGKFIYAKGPVELLSINNMRQNRPTMNDTNTPISLDLDVINCTVTNSIIFGDINVTGGQSGRYTFQNIDFPRTKRRKNLGVGRVKGDYLKERYSPLSLNVYGERNNGIGNITIGGGERLGKAPETLSGLAKSSNQRGSAFVTSGIGTIAEFLSGNVNESGCSFYVDQVTGSFYITSNAYIDEEGAWKAYTKGIVTQLVIGGGEIRLFSGVGDRAGVNVKLIEVK